MRKVHLMPHIHLRSLQMGLTSVLVLFAIRAPVLAQSASSDQGKPAPLTWTAQQDHQNMLDQLGIKKLRPGPSGRAGAPNSANYDESKANPYPDLPDPLTLNNGQKVTTPQIWQTQRHPEIVEDFEREVIGRVPANVPKVIWTITKQVNDGIIGASNIPVTGKQLTGHVDNPPSPTSRSISK